MKLCFIRCIASIFPLPIIFRIRSSDCNLLEKLIVIDLLNKEGVLEAGRRKKFSSSWTLRCSSSLIDSSIIAEE